MLCHDIFCAIKTFKFKSQSIKTFLFIFILLSLPLIILYCVFYDNINQSFYKNMYKELNASSYYAGSVIDSKYDIMLDFCTKMLSNPDFLIAYSANELSDIHYQCNKSLYTTMSSFAQSDNLISSIYIYSPCIDYVFSSNPQSPSSPMIQFLDGTASDILNSSYQNTEIRFFDSEYYISAAFPFNISGEKNVTLVFNIKFSDILSTIKSNNKNLLRLYILDSGNNVLATNNFQAPVMLPNGSCNMKNVFINPNIKTAFKYKNLFYTSYYIKSLNYYIVCVSDSNISVAELHFKNLLLLFLLLLFLIFIALICSLYFYNSIYKILKIFKVQNKAFDIRLAKEYRTNEISYIISHINSLLSSNTKMQILLSNKLNELHEAQLNYLQTQINPHFLFNVLNAINAIIIEDCDSSSTADCLIDGVSKILKYSLDNTVYVVRLSEDIEYLKLYVNIQLILHEHSFRFYCDIDEKLLNCKTPKFSFQPIVENAISHGLSYNNYVGEIKIWSEKKHDNDILIYISNDGRILTEAEVNDINNHIKNHSIKSEKSIGVTNIDRRIKLLFGEKYGCYAEYSPNKTLFVVKIPFIE